MEGSEVTDSACHPGVLTALRIRSGLNSASGLRFGSSALLIRNHADSLLGSLVDCWRTVGMEYVEIRHLLLLQYEVGRVMRLHSCQHSKTVVLKGVI